MKHCLLYSLLALMCLLSLASCDKEPTRSFRPSVVSVNGSAEDEHLNEVFRLTKFPKGTLPVLAYADSIKEPLRTSREADEYFDHLDSQIADSLEFSKYGVMIYVTHHPRLVQIRVGEYYETLAGLTGVTQGKNYYDQQQRFMVDSTRAAAFYILLRALSENLYKSRDLNWWQRMQLSNAKSAINEFLSWAALPRDDFWGICISKPTQMVMTAMADLCGSWRWAILLTFLGIMILKGICNMLFVPIVNATSDAGMRKVANTCRILICEIIGLAYSVSSFAAGYVLCRGRMEDFLSGQAMGLSMESLMFAPERFVHEQSIWLSLLFVMSCIVAYVGTSDFFKNAILPASEQRRRWSQLSGIQQAIYTAAANSDVSDLDEQAAPFLSQIDGLLKKVGGLIPGLCLASMFFLTDAVMYCAIYFNLALLASHVLEYVNLARISNKVEGDGYFAAVSVYLGGFVLIGSAVLLVMLWILSFFSPF